MNDTAPYVYSNEVRRGPLPGEILGSFTSHGAAVCAFVKLRAPNFLYSPLGGWQGDDLAEFWRMKARMEEAK